MINKIMQLPQKFKEMDILCQDIKTVSRETVEHTIANGVALDKIRGINGFRGTES